MDESLYWEAVANRDAAFDGKFVFAVATTGIYCRPSCSAKRAKRSNVKFYLNNAAAEQDGFRPCLRCKPASVGFSPAAEIAIEIAKDPELAAHVQIAKVAADQRVTPQHLQRKFKADVGISAKQFADAKRFELFRAEVAGGGDVTDAIYAAGFGSSSRLYESADERLGMTPATYKRGGAGATIRFAVADCEFGKMLAARTERGVCSVAFGDSVSQLEADLKSEFPNATIERDDNSLAALIAEVVDRINGRRTGTSLPLDIRATAFQIQVWDELSKIPYGETASYGEVAERLGDRKKVRAVARACATNAVAVLIPCHRVVASDGKLSGYRWGIDRKRALLEREQSHAVSPDLEGLPSSSEQR